MNISKVSKGCTVVLSALEHWSTVYTLCVWTVEVEQFLSALRCRKLQTLNNIFNKALHESKVLTDWIDN